MQIKREIKNRNNQFFEKIKEKINLDNKIEHNINLLN